MRFVHFFIIVTLSLLLVGCTKMEAQGNTSGIRVGFIEKESQPAPPAPTLESVSNQSVESLPLAPNTSTNGSLPIAELIIEPGPEQSIGPTPIELTPQIINTTIVNATNVTPQAQPINVPPPVPADQNNPLGFPIRIDANRYYKDGAVPCHNGYLTQCVHIYVGVENCTACHYDPEVIMVPVGTTLEWGNHDSIQHQVIAQDNSFISPLLEPIINTAGAYPNYFASHFTHTFITPGEYAYRGEDGSTLNGVVIVVPSLT